MRRRQFLPALAAGLVPLTGCSSRPLTTQLSGPKVETKDRRTDMGWSRNGTDYLSLGVLWPETADDGGRIPLTFDLWHAADTHLDAFRFRLRAPPSVSGGVRADVYLKRPGGDG